MFQKALIFLNGTYRLDKLCFYQEEIELFS